MKLLVINTSVNENAKQVAAYCENKVVSYGIACDVFCVGDEVHVCTACGKCIKKRECIFEDVVNEVNRNGDLYDGLLVIGDAHYGREADVMIRLVQRLMRSGNHHWVNKIGSVLFFSRKENTLDAFWKVISYFRYACMIPVFGRHTNAIVGEAMDEVDCVVEQMCWLMNRTADSRPLKSVDKVMDFLR